MAESRATRTLGNRAGLQGSNPVEPLQNSENGAGLSLQVEPSRHSPGTAITMVWEIKQGEDRRFAVPNLSYAFMEKMALPKALDLSMDAGCYDYSSA